MFKVNFIYEEYLDSVPHNLNCFITILRISAHSLRIHTGRVGVVMTKYLYNLACYAKEALTLRNNSDFITIH